ncbi:polysaccharide biosynthesis tyrosine autokinase [Altererythrobacter soli]|uniref:Polysaccharide biosynthesis tyrosine autokinase n=1 Tax=Croceibacterium soli TaxID=1739690 RepID=A0A6I4UNG0_9SPHN|nr:polysaccharide biosynthesis tyrosine autokinase [Croceibacterium soli]MXP40278.1 polysaccharide biosynthesis tyrosine autokinase [Croceibacterium soli]
MNNLAFQSAIADEAFPPDRDAGESRPPSQRPWILYYLDIVRRRKWLLVGAVVIAVIIGLVVTLLMTPQYTASSTLEIRRESAGFVGIEGAEPEAAGVDQEFYQTQWGLLESQSLAERVAAQLRLHENAAFFEMFGSDEHAASLRTSPSAADASQRQERIKAAADLLLDNVSIEPERLSRLVTVKFTSPSPAMSMQIVNAWGNAYIETSLERRFEATSYARTFLEERLNQLRDRLQDSERALVSYAGNQRIINIPTSTTTGSDSLAATERPIVAEDLSALNRELNEATGDRIAAESRLRESRGASPEALSNPVITQLRTRRASLASDYAQLTSQFEPEYPAARALADQIAETDRAIAREEARVRASSENAFASAVDRERMLRTRVNSLEADLLDLRGRTIQYNIFQREVDTNRQLYDALLQRYKEVGVAGGVGVNNISIVDPAKLPERPSSPNLVLNILLSIIIGGTIGVALAIALEVIDDTISDPRELGSLLGLPLLGTIPSAESDDPAEELNDPKTPLVEAYLSTLTRLAFTTEHGIPRSLAITSTRPGEGKSTTAYALARQLSRTSGGVVLVDGDMRSPSLHQMFDLANERGLSHYLAGDDHLDSMLHARPDEPTLLLAGPMPPNAAELLTGDRMALLLRELSSRFEYVIIDAPPVMGLADTPLIGSRVEGVVYVVESHETRTSLAQIAVGRLRDSHSRVLGGLLTKFQAQKAHYGYGYDYGYGYGDGRRAESEAA